MHAPTPRPERERGQVLVIFALALVAIVAMTGLVLDGGSTFVQRRSMQNVADAAALAGAYDYVNNANSASAIAAAQAAAAANGYTNGSNGVVVNVSLSGPDSDGATYVTASITKPHPNSFSGIVGMASWNVSTTAQAETGAPNGVVGALPLIFNKKAFPAGNGPSNEMNFDEPGSGNADVPQQANQFNWTVFCTANGNPCNANSSDVQALIDGVGNGDVSYVTKDELIGPLNAGSHTTLFSALANLVGGSFPVAVVDDSGAFVGYSIFHLTGSVGGSTKQIRGYFDPGIATPPLKIVKGHGPGVSTYGAYVVNLVN